MQVLHAAPRALTRPRIVRGLAPEIAFGRACAHLMSRPAFARAPFGHIARALAGQANRGHCAFAQRGAATVGFAGWALVDEARAEAWLAGVRGFSDAEAAAGDRLVLNFWQADDAETTQALIAHLRGAYPHVRALYARRHYSDGRMRPVRLAVGRGA